MKTPRPSMGRITPAIHGRLARLAGFRLMLGAFAAIVVSSLHAAEFTLGPYFTDNMVLQKPERALGGTFIWARTDLDERITVEFQGKDQGRATVKNGIWRAPLNDLDANLGPSDLVIRNRAKQELVRLTNVVVGEVWVLGVPSPATVEFRPEWREKFTNVICFGKPDDPGVDRRLRVLQFSPTGAAAVGATAPGDWHVVQPEDCVNSDRPFSNDAAHLARTIFIGSLSSVRYVGIIELPKKQLASLLPVGLPLPSPSKGEFIDHGFVTMSPSWPSQEDSKEARKHYFEAVANLKRIGLVTNTPPPVELARPQQYSRGSPENLKRFGLDFSVRGCMW